MLSHGVEEALETAVAYAVGWSTKVRDAGSTGGDEVFGGEDADLVVVRADEVGVEVGVGSIEQDEGRALLGDPAEVDGGGLAGGYDEGVEAIGHEVLDLGLFEGGVAVGGGDDEEEVVLAELGGEGLGDLSEEGVDEVGDDEADEFAVAGDEGAGHEVGAVVELFDAREDLVPCLDGDVGMVAEGLGDGDDGDSESLGDVFHADWHGGDYTSGGGGMHCVG